MRYLLFLIGVDFSDKQRMDKKLKGLKYEGLKYIFTSGAIMVHIKTDECKDKLKSDISEIAMDLSCLYFLSDFPDKLSCNLGDDDAKYLFDFTYDVEIESEFDFAEIFRTINDYIGTLKQFFRKNTKYDVSFIDTEIENDNGDTKAGIIIDKKFKSIIKDNKTGEILGLGFGRRKKISQKKAAKDALIKLKIIGNEEDEDEYYE